MFFKKILVGMLGSLFEQLFELLVLYVPVNSFWLNYC